MLGKYKFPPLAAVRAIYASDLFPNFLFKSSTGTYCYLSSSAAILYKMLGKRSALIHCQGHQRSTAFFDFKDKAEPSQIDLTLDVRAISADLCEVNGVVLNRITPAMSLSAAIQVLRGNRSLDDMPPAKKNNLRPGTLRESQYARFQGWILSNVEDANSARALYGD